MQLSWYRPIHQKIVQNREPLLAFFKIAQVVTFASIGAAAWLYVHFPEFRAPVYGLAEKAGQLATGFYMLTLIPGILKRTGWFPLFRATLMIFRRHFGIMMFALAYLHSAVVLTIPSFASGNFPPTLTPHTLYGSIGLYLLFPLWLTSNDWSIKKLGKKVWKWVHRLTYIALMFVFLHVSMESAKQGILLGVTMLLAIYSWIKVWTKPKQVVATEPETDVPPQEPA